jgi:pimeloyl-ACP methyl ester carboxylesterase
VYVEPRQVQLPDGRALTVDDVGDPDGSPVLYLHGTPDSRLARHPDDGLTASAGVRLLAVDRPGYGGSDPLPPGAAAGAFAGDVARLLDALGVERCAVLAWSGGALAGLAVAAGLAERVDALGIAAGLVPRQAYEDADVRAAAPERLDMHGMADELPPGELGEAVAPLLAPFPCDLALAAEHQREQRDAASAAELASVPGALATMAAALAEGVRDGLAGVAADVESVNRPLDVDLATIRGPVHLWWGAEDTITPPAFGSWYAARLADAGATLDVVPGSGHYLPLTHWVMLLRALTAAA